LLLLFDDDFRFKEQIIIDFFEFKFPSVIINLN